MLGHTNVNFFELFAVGINLQKSREGGFVTRARYSTVPSVASGSPCLYGAHSATFGQRPNWPRRKNSQPMLPLLINSMGDLE